MRVHRNLRLLLFQKFEGGLADGFAITARRSQAELQPGCCEIDEHHVRGVGAGRGFASRYQRDSAKRLLRNRFRPGCETQREEQRE